MRNDDAGEKRNLNFFIAMKDSEDRSVEVLNFLQPEIKCEAHLIHWITPKYVEMKWNST